MFVVDEVAAVVGANVDANNAVEAVVVEAFIVDVFVVDAVFCCRRGC